MFTEHLLCARHLLDSGSWDGVENEAGRVPGLQDLFMVITGVRKGTVTEASGLASLRKWPLNGDLKDP